MKMVATHTRLPTSYRPRDPAATSYLMSRIRATTSKTEVALRSQLHRSGFRFRKHVRSILGSPDIVFPRERVAVFIDGDYWHARVLQERGISALKESLKTANRAFWIAKLRRNVERDAEVTTGLQDVGWQVLRVWESDAKKNMEAVVRQIADAVTRRRRSLNLKRQRARDVMDHGAARSRA